jgi:hypothetical protein
MSKRFSILKIVFSTAVAIVVCYLLLSKYSIQSIPETVAKVPMSALGFGFGLYCLLVWTKAARFRELLRLDCGIEQLFPILALYTFWGNILPMRSGDVSYVYLMAQRERVDGTKSVASLMLASIIDLVLLIGLMTGTGWRLHSDLQGQLSYVVLFLIPLLVGISLIGLMLLGIIAPSACNRLAERCVNPLLRLNLKWVSWIGKKSLEIVRELTQIRLDARFCKTWGYSILSMGVRFGFQCYLVREMSINIPVLKLLFALAFTNIFNLLPIQSVGNLGTIEAPFAWALVQCGTSGELAVVTGFSLHLLILLYCLPMGGYGLVKKPSVRNNLKGEQS